ncbi:hypothetical protein DL95DRAFT_458874 [Leptodontidium sp. 2 PMI_412]|nr:hypothetical protein DL95DRAFT_458874 [Leptodontidium sp. 2 PMI_412]
MSDNLSGTAMETAIIPSPERGAFSLFPKLPLELRRMIWRASCVDNKPRMIQITFAEPLRNYKLTASYKIPFQLKISQESRACAKEFYDAVFAERLKKNIPVYFNSAIDAVVFDGCDVIYQFVDLGWTEDEESLGPRRPDLQKTLAIGIKNMRVQDQLLAIPILKALGSPEHLIILPLFGNPRHPRRNTAAWNYLRSIWMDKDWPLQNSNGQGGYGGPKAELSSVKEFQTMLWNIPTDRHVAAERMWTDALVDVDSLDVGLNRDYQFPGITSLTFIQLQAKLVDLDDPTLALKKKERQLARELKKEIVRKWPPRSSDKAIAVQPVSKPRKLRKLRNCCPKEHMVDEVGGIGRSGLRHIAVEILRMVIEDDSPLCRILLSMGKWRGCLSYSFFSKVIAYVARHGLHEDVFFGVHSLRTEG